MYISMCSYIQRPIGLDDCTCIVCKLSKLSKRYAEKESFITHFSTRERLCECIGIYRHVVVNIVLFYAHACIQ